jgi:hypothetical protein
MFAMSVSSKEERQRLRSGLYDDYREFMESVYIGCLEPPSGADDAPLGMYTDSARFLSIPGLSEFPGAKSAAFGSNDPKAATLPAAVRFAQKLIQGSRKLKANFFIAPRVTS